MTRFCLSALLAATAVASLFASQPTFRSSVAIVRIDASVMDGNRPVAGLTKDNFTITDNGIPQMIDTVSLDTVPLGLMLLLDTSESLEGDPMSALANAARSLVQSLRPDDAAALMLFADQVRLTVPATRERPPMLTAIANLTAAGATSINDAVVLSLLHEPTVAPDMRPVMMVFTDGRDTASWLMSDQAQQAARRSRTLIHVVELRTVAGGGTNFARELAKAGGGRVWSATSANALRQLFGDVLNELRARYLITYYPTGVAREGWLEVKVRTKAARTRLR